MKIARVNFNNITQPKSKENAKAKTERLQTTGLQRCFVVSNFNSTNVVSFKNNFVYNSQNFQEGYLKEKKYIANTLLYPLKSKDTYNAVAVPPIFLIHASDDIVKNNIRNEVVKDLSPHCKMVYWDARIKSEDFLKELREQMQASKNNYLRNGKRTIIFIDNIEKYIGKNCSENIASMKSIADYCSKSPISHSDSNAALSIISFTDKPDLIDSELLFRPEKVYSIAFAPLKTEGIKNLLEKETELKEKFFSSLKKMPEDELRKQDLPYLSWKNLQRLKANSNIYSLTTDSSNIPFETIAYFASPKEELGAFTCKQLQDIVQDASFKYIANTHKSFATILIEQIAKAKRQISPEKLKEEIKLKNLIELKKDKTAIKEIAKTQNLLKMLKLGFLNKEQKNELAERLFESNVRRIFLEPPKNGALLTEEEVFEHKELQKLLNVEKNIKNLELGRLCSHIVSERINPITNDRYKFSYGNGINDFVDLYLGSFGWDDHTLWIDSGEISKIETVMHFIDDIKNNTPFKNIQIIEFPLDGKNDKDFTPTGRRTLDNKPIYQISIKEKQI